MRLMPQIKGLLDFINNEEGTNFNKFPLGKSIKEETLNKLKESDIYKEVFGRALEVSASNVEFHYNNKDNFYIHIGKKGTYYIGQNPLGIENIDRFDFPLELQFNLKRGGRTKSQKEKGLVNFSFSGELKLKNSNIKSESFTE